MINGEWGMYATVNLYFHYPLNLFYTCPYAAGGNQRTEERA